MTESRQPPAADDLVAVASMLWPAPASAALVRGRRPASDERVLREFAFLPDARRPRLVVPVDVPAAAAASVRRYSQALRPVERYGRAAFALALRAGLGDRLFADRVRVSVPAGLSEPGYSVEDVLAEILGEPVLVSLGLGNLRANQKPILHALSPSGRALAFVKVGDRDSTRELVIGEAEALRTVEAFGLRRIAAPRVIALVPWEGLTLLVLSPLPTSARRARRTQDPPYREIAELATAGGVTTAVLEESPYWRNLRAGLVAVADRETADQLDAVAAAVEREHGGTVLRFGSWHGDFTPWNLHRGARGIALWDWERFATDVPLGFDALHYRRTADGQRSGDVHAVTARIHASPETDLARVGVPAETARATVTLYLLELCIRFVVASQGETGAPLRAEAGWLLDFLTAHVLRPERSPLRGPE